MRDYRFFFISQLINVLIWYNMCLIILLIIVKRRAFDSHELQYFFVCCNNAQTFTISNISALVDTYDSYVLYMRKNLYISYVASWSENVFSLNSDGRFKSRWLVGNIYVTFFSQTIIIYRWTQKKNI